LAIPFLNKTNIPLENHWMYFLFLSNLDTSNNPFPLKLLWSIAVEEQFYIIFILISPLFKRFLGLVVLIMLLSSITITALLLKQNIGVYSFLSTYLLDFSIGIFFGKLFFEQRKMNIIFMGIYLIIITPLLFYIFTLNSYIDNYLNLPISIAFGVLIYITTLIFKTKKINKLPLFKATEYLGQYTYSLYVLSGLTITFIVGFVPLKSILFASLLKLILLVPIAFLSFHFYEKPFLRLKERFR
jgi:peptidoglycan/LPS O-acetylase OafA/YrhL